MRTPQGFVPTPVERSAAGDEVAVTGIAALKGAWLGLGQEEGK